MHYQIAVRVLHGGAYLNEQFQALANEQGAAVAVAVDGLAIDVLHDEIRRSILEIAAVDQTCNRGVIEGGEDVPFAVQAAAQSRMQGRVLQNLDGHRLLVLRLVALAAIHGAHAAVPENRGHAIRADLRADQSILVALQQRLCGFAYRLQQRVLAGLVGREQGFERGAQFLIVAACARQTCQPLGRPGLDQLLEQRLNLLPACLRDHAGHVPPISFNSQARASRMSRCTVATEDPTAAAICS